MVQTIQVCVRFCRLTVWLLFVVNYALFGNARVSDATALSVLQSATLPLICSNEGATLFVIFFFPYSFLLQGMHVEIYPGKKKLNKKKNKHWFRREKKKTTTQSLQSDYLSVTQLDHSRNIASCKHAFVEAAQGPPPPETVQLIWKKTRVCSEMFNNCKFSTCVECCPMIPNSCTASLLFTPQAHKSWPFPTRMTQVLSMRNASD